MAHLGAFATHRVLWWKQNLCVRGLARPSLACRAACSEPRHDEDYETYVRYAKFRLEQEQQDCTAEVDTRPAYLSNTSLASSSGHDASSEHHLNHVSVTGMRSVNEVVDVLESLAPSRAQQVARPLVLDKGIAGGLDPIMTPTGTCDIGAPSDGGSDEDWTDAEWHAYTLDSSAPGASIPVQPPHQIEVCSRQHPGAVCCTTTTIEERPDTDCAVVTLRTVVRLGSPSSHSPGTSGSPVTVLKEDAVALAAQALLISAHDMCREYNKKHAERWRNQDAEAEHKRIVSILEHGHVEQVEWHNVNSFGHECFLLHLKHPETNEHTRALFKPHVEGGCSGWHRASMEWVAYKLNLLLGMDYVPPVAYRDIVFVDGQEFPGGAFMHFVHDANMLRTVEGKWPAEVWEKRRDLLLSDTRILDVLLHNSDRHHGHFMYGRHWLAPHKERPFLIDHAAAFRTEAFVNMDHENAFGTGAVRCVSEKTYIALRFLDAAAIAAAFSGWLSACEMAQLLARRNKILAYLDNLVDTQGYEATVVKDDSGAHHW